MTVRIGTETSGDPAYACKHMAQWWPRFVEIVGEQLGVEMEIIQALGDASASAGTHGKPGTALDLRTWRFYEATVLKIVARARRFGAPATWYRSKLQGFEPHIHLVLDCPCTSPADYQITAVKQGYNGLGAGGRGGPDYHPKPDAWRDYAQGIRLMEDEMAITDSDKRDIAKLAADEVWSRMLLHPDGDDAKRVRADMAHFWDRRVLDRVAAKVGAPVDVDESAIAESLIPAIREAVEAAGSTDPDVIATAVAKKLGTSLSNA